MGKIDALSQVWRRIKKMLIDIGFSLMAFKGLGLRFWTVSKGY